MSEITYYTEDQTEVILKQISNLKHKLCITIMLDAGLRVSEMRKLRYQDIDFASRLLKVKSLKKRGQKEVVRKVPLTERLYTLLVAYINNEGRIRQEDYIFPAVQDSGKPMSRQTVNTFLRRYKHKFPELPDKLNPHSFRHTFATRLREKDEKIENVKDLLGHEHINTTLIYAHITPEKSKEAIAKLDKPKTFLQKLRGRLQPEKLPAFQISVNKKHELIGRDEELKKIATNLQKRVHTVLLGAQGTGKSLLLRQLQPDGQKLIRLDDLKDQKRSLANLCLYLIKDDKEKLAQTILSVDKDFDFHLTKQSVKNLCQIAKVLSAKYEYTLVIDSIDRLTDSQVRMLEFLKSHFILICAAREIPIARAGFLMGFERIDVKDLERSESLQLIHQLSDNIEVENRDMYRNHIYEQSGGNPQAIVDQVERYRKEPLVTNKVLHKINMVNPRREFDMTFLVVLVLSMLAIARYLGSEIENPALKLLGGSALIILIVLRYFLNQAKRKKL